jgi:hypothetical protein
MKDPFDLAIDEILRCADGDIRSALRAVRWCCTEHQHMVSPK